MKIKFFVLFLKQLYKHFIPSENIPKKLSKKKCYLFNIPYILKTSLSLM